MAFTYTIDTKRHHALLVGSGHVTGRECANAVLQLVHDPHFHPHFTVMADVRGVAYDAQRQYEVMEVARTLFLMGSRFRNRIAVVASGPLLLTAQVFATLVARTHTVILKVFTDPASADDYCRQGTHPLHRAAG